MSLGITEDEWRARMQEYLNRPHARKKQLTDEQLKYVRIARDMGVPWTVISREFKKMGVEMADETIRRRFQEAEND